MRLDARPLTALIILMAVVMVGCDEGVAERAKRRAHEPMPATYDGVFPRLCAGANKAGALGYTDSMRTPLGIAFSVVTPSNFDPQLGHPLMVVYAPARADRFSVERVTKFTGPATRAGFLLAYADHPPLGPSSTRDLAHIRALVEERWCVDPARVFYTGHSDGGTVAHALAVMPQTRGNAAGIAPSGAGMRAEDLATYGCPKPVAVMVIHSRRDEKFPLWGQGTLQWWASCNACDRSRPVQTANGCTRYLNCAQSAQTMLCEHDEIHAKWPAHAQAIVDFFQAIPSQTLR